MARTLEQIQDRLNNNHHCWTNKWSYSHEQIPGTKSYYEGEAVRELNDYAQWARDEIKSLRKAAVEGGVAEYDSDGEFQLAEVSTES